VCHGARGVTNTDIDTNTYTDRLAQQLLRPRYLGYRYA
jgi:hypothetical protein